MSKSRRQIIMKIGLMVMFLFMILVIISSLVSISKPSYSIPSLVDGFGITFSNERSEYGVDNNTMALWHFNEGEGSILYDETDYNNDGAIYGANWIEGYFGSALNFDGVNDYVMVPYSSSIGELPAITLEAWIFRNSNQDGAIIAKNGPYSLYIIGDKLEAGIYTTLDGWHKLLGTTILEPDRWYHVAMTFDGDYLKIYVDGVEDASMSLSGTISVTSQDLYIGWYNGASPPYDKFFNGIIDEARISNIARTDFNIDNDIDNDGVLDEEDNCVTTFNPSQTDLDNDEVGDWCDNCILHNNPSQSDTDNNYIGDACEGCNYRWREFCSWE